MGWGGEMNIIQSKAEKLAPIIDIEMGCGYHCQKLSLTLNMRVVSP